MINYRNGKRRYKVNELGSLYVDEKKVSDNEQPIIYIGGQMEHRGHVIERSGYTSDKNHNLFTGSWMYEYPINTGNKQEINSQKFSENLLQSLKEAHLGNVILVTNSHGGIVGSYASKSDLVSKVICFHAPLVGTPLANLDIEKCKILLKKYQYLLSKLIKIVANMDYGFQLDNYRGINMNDVDLNKIIMVGNYIDINNERNKLMLATYEIIQTLTSYKSDGVVVFEPVLFEQLGINYLQVEDHINHFKSVNSEYIKNTLERVLKL